MKYKNVLYEYKNKFYPNYIKNGNAVKFIVPFAEQFCKGNGLDIGGFGSQCFPNAKLIDIQINDKWDAYNLPNKKYDYIFSSHTLEHLSNYVSALTYWKNHLKKDGVLFLYLPHPDMEYWLPQNNQKHLHKFYPKDIKNILYELNFSKVIVSKRDLYYSFSVIGFMS